MTCTTEMILCAVKDKCSTRDKVALLYALAIKDAFERTDWRMVNRAAICRWSRHGLEYIKQRAWKIVEQHERAGQSSTSVESSDSIPTDQ